jgi:hypothetical protein
VHCSNNQARIVKLNLEPNQENNLILAVLIEIPSRRVYSNAPKQQEIFFGGVNNSRIQSSCIIQTAMCEIKLEEDQI